MSDWEPNPTGLEQLRSVLSGTLSPNKDERLAANDALDQARLQPDLDNYLLYILVSDVQSASGIRAAAGLMLKNNILKHDFVNSKSKELQESILSNILKGLLDNEVLVRNITGNVITALFQLYGIRDWPQILIQLLELTNGEKGNSLISQEGAISALAKICEDSSVSLDYNYNGQVPSEFLIPSFLNLLGHQSAFVVSKAISCMNQFITLKSASVEQNFDDILTKLFGLTSFDSNEIRKNICTAFYLILDNNPEKLYPHIQGITSYCLHTIIETTNSDSTNYNEEVALEACEFLLGLSTSNIDPQLVKSLLPNIVPLLVEKMIYSKSDIEYYQHIDSFDDADVEDKDEDIKPTNAKTKEKTANKMTSGEVSANVNGNAITNKANADDDEDDDDDNDEDEEEEAFTWNLRKCAAATLDVLASTLPNEVIDLVLPLLEGRIVSDQWPVREAAILAFGAISDACIEFETDNLPNLVPFLVERLQDSEPRVRQITCWTLSRYSSWVCQEAHQGGQYASYFLPTLEAIMACALDNKKIVQESASSSLANFITNADYELTVNLVEPLLHHFNRCFKKYKRKNLVILYDAVQTFVDKVGDIISSKQEYITLLLPPLLEKWEQLPDEDKDLWPLLECMSSVAASLGELFAPYAVPAYQRAIRILENCINLDKMCQTDPTISSPEKDFIVTAVDLIDGLIQGLGIHSAELIIQNSNSTNLVDLLLTCFQDPVNEVRQSSFALLGDLSICVLRPVVLPYLDPIMQCIIHEINNRSFESSAVCNNATWTLGEMSLVLTNQELKPYLSSIIPSLIRLVNSTGSEQTVLENAAITLGRLGTFCAGELSQHLAEYSFSWSKYMKYLEPNEEKETAFKGMCNTVAANPTGFGNTEEGKNSLLVFIDCISSYAHPSVDLNNMFQKLIDGYKEMLGFEWNNLLTGLDFESQQVLRTKYNA